MSRLIDGPIEVNVDAVLENGGEFAADEPVEIPIDHSALRVVIGLAVTLAVFVGGFFYGLAG